MSYNSFEDKVLGYLAQLTQEMTGIKQDVSGIEQDVSGIKQDVSGMNTRLTNLEGTVARIEVEHGEKLSALFDGHRSDSEQLNRIEDKVDSLIKIVSSHDVSIEVMRRAK